MARERTSIEEELVHTGPQGRDHAAPRYDGLSTVNLVSSLIRTLGGTCAQPELRSGLVDEGLFDGVRTIVLLVIDALGYDQLLDEVALGNAPAFARLIKHPTSGFVPLTTVFPSTTSAALVSLNTAATPLEHGNAGYQAYLPQIDGIGNLLYFYRADNPDIPLQSYGIDPHTWLAAPTTYIQLAQAGVPSYYVNPRQYMDSPLSMMNSAGATYLPYVVQSDIFARVNQAVSEGRRHERSFVFAYWSSVDTICHAYGTQSAEHHNEVAMLDWLIQRELLDAISDLPDTLLVITADHGHINISPQTTYSLNDCTDLLELLRQHPAGDTRCRYLYLHEGTAKQALRIIERDMAGIADALPLPEYLGLFGSGTAHPEFAARAGDILLLPRPGWGLSYQFPGQPKRKYSHTGVHGGLHRTEMLVPALLHRPV